MAKMISLQRKLLQTSMLGSVVAGVIALILLVGISIYQTMSVQDEIMDEISDMLLISDLTANSGQQVDELSSEFDIEYQLRMNQHVLTQSTQYSFPQDQFITQKDEYSYIWYKKRIWRSYHAKNEDHNMQVQVLQPLHVRFEEMLQSFLGYTAVLLFLWCLQWLITHFSIKRQFQTLHQLSREISEKNAEDLSPIQQKEPELEELQPMIKQLNQLLARLEDALIREQRFTADASHELRSPLSAIQMRLQVLKRKYSDVAPEIKQDLIQIQQDVDRGTRILENLIMLARLDPTQSTQVVMTKVYLPQLIDEVMSALAPFAEQKNIQFHLEIMPSEIKANQELIFICIRNLLDNAIRYAEFGGNIYIHLNSDQQNSILTIEDDGKKLTEQVINRLGERFYRALGTKTQGSGLGLSICKKIIELHHASIQFSPSEYHGLKVQLNFSND
ncbi:sensor histidine kinase [Acinetobacter gerneri]|uniref:sensor histidine kinase n=1 Tax=Acinetobacter gerneri TaxID=202952 RepID=UPI0023F41304|nr:ATP-binding protein [Acinetobacter gerneri]MCH4245629.1 ATP-binding protein [Acinetobacter gerneri]